MHHPWRAFRTCFPHWQLLFDQLAVAGRTCFATRTVTLDRGLLQAERRSVIEHEMQHMMRGPVPRDERLAAREEQVVQQAAARRLIPIGALGEALAWAADIHEAADELWVDTELVQCRLDHLHPSERHYLRRRLEHLHD